MTRITERIAPESVNELTGICTQEQQVCASQGREGGYIGRQEILWSDDLLKNGISIKLKELPIRVRLFIAMDGYAGSTVEIGQRTFAASKCPCPSHFAPSLDRCRSKRVPSPGASFTRACRNGLPTGSQL